MTQATPQPHVTKADARAALERFRARAAGTRLAEYVPVDVRLKFFRSVHPDGLVETKLEALDGLLYCRARIAVRVGGVLVDLATATKRVDNKRGAPLEMAESGAIGRALTHAGFFGPKSGADDGPDAIDLATIRAQIELAETMEDLHAIGARIAGLALPDQDQDDLRTLFTARRGEIADLNQDQRA